MKNYYSNPDLGEYYLVKPIGDEPAFDEEWEYKLNKKTKTNINNGNFKRINLWHFISSKSR